MDGGRVTTQFAHPEIPVEFVEPTLTDLPTQPVAPVAPGCARTRPKMGPG